MLRLQPGISAALPPRVLLGALHVGEANRLLSPREGIRAESAAAVARRRTEAGGWPLVRRSAGSQFPG